MKKFTIAFATGLVVVAAELAVAGTRSLALAFEEHKDSRALSLEGEGQQPAGRTGEQGIGLTTFPGHLAFYIVPGHTT